MRRLLQSKCMNLLLVSSVQVSLQRCGIAQEAQEDLQPCTVWGLPVLGSTCMHDQSMLLMSFRDVQERIIRSKAVVPTKFSWVFNKEVPVIQV